MLVHGFASSFERNWREPGWADLLEEEGRAVMGVDLPGHGEADKPTDPAAYAALEESVIAALPPAGQVDAVGFSLGAQVLLRAASAAPGRFRRIVLGGVGDGVFAGVDPEPVARAVETGPAAQEAGPAAAAPAHLAAAPGNGPGPPAAAEVGAVRVPVLIVRGERACAGPADRLLAALPDARLVSLSRTDHFGTPKDFRFAAAALDFVRT